MIEFLAEWLLALLLHQSVRHYYVYRVHLQFGQEFLTIFENHTSFFLLPESFLLLALLLFTKSTALRYFWLIQFRKSEVIGGDPEVKIVLPLGSDIGYLSEMSLL